MQAQTQQSVVKRVRVLTNTIVLLCAFFNSDHRSRDVNAQYDVSYFMFSITIWWWLAMQIIPPAKFNHLS